MPKVIKKSGMKFIADNIFHIEKSILYTGLRKGIKCRDIKMVIEVDLPDYLNRIWKPKVYVINYKAAIKYNMVIA